MGLLDLVGLFGNAIGQSFLNIGSVISTVVNGILSVLAGLAGVLTQIYGDLTKVFQKLSLFLLHVWRWLAKTWLGKLVREIIKIRDKIDNWLKPILKQIQIMRQQEELLYKLYIQPVLNFISRMRQALILLRAMHVKFAAQLDQDLAEIQGKIAQVVIDARAQLNALAGYINVVLDPLGNLRWGPYINTTLKGIGALTNAIWGAQNNPLGAIDQAQQSADARALDAKSVKAEITLQATGGLQPAQQSMTAEIYADLQNRGYQILAVK